MSKNLQASCPLAWFAASNSRRRTVSIGASCSVAFGQSQFRPFKMWTLRGPEDDKSNKHRGCR
jgi:hypothetical protein